MTIAKNQLTEQVLVTRNSSTIHFSKSNYFRLNLKEEKSWQNCLMRDATFIDRWLAESDNTILQLIPYIILFSGNNSIFHYQRKGNSEKRLDSKWSIGVGGHINQADMKTSEVTWDTVINGAVREVTEEMEISADFVRRNLIFIGSIYTPEDGKELNVVGPSVGEVHLGLVYIIKVPSSVKVREKDNLVNASFISLADQDIDKYELWSKMILEKLKSTEII